MSFESDKSDRYFTQGVLQRCFNRAIGLFPAEKAEGTRKAVPFVFSVSLKVSCAKKPLSHHEGDCDAFCTHLLLQ